MPTDPNHAYVSYYPFGGKPISAATMGGHPPSEIQSLDANRTLVYHSGRFYDPAPVVLAAGQESEAEMPATPGPAKDQSPR